ncbi:hypothetical protein QP162_12725 [Sphingomonas aurantiaca]|uniref:hypothetical protein n=1 Tax=Sphingomonas aurantiaca TaxID=185949 RepID=UPI002FE2545D
MALSPHTEDNVFDVPWDALATLWRRKGRQCGPGSRELLAVGSLREIVLLVASMKPSAQNSLRVVLPDQNCWPFGFFGKQQLNNLIELEARSHDL